MNDEMTNTPIVIKNPSEKMKALLKRMEEDKLKRRKELLDSKSFTFTI